LINLIREKQHRFIGDFTSISDIDVRRIKDHPEYVADYVFKNAKQNAAIMDEILILPKSPQDVSPRDEPKRVFITPHNIVPGVTTERSRIIYNGSFTELVSEGKSIFTVAVNNGILSVIERMHLQTLVKIACVLGAIVVLKSLSVYFDFDWPTLASQTEAVQFP